VLRVLFSVDDCEPVDVWLGSWPWLARRVRQSWAGKSMQEKPLADVHVRVCMYKGAGVISMIYGGIPGCKMVCCAVP
jgi:hypothetical protein